MGPDRALSDLFGRVLEPADLNPRRGRRGLLQGKGGRAMRKIQILAVALMALFVLSASLSSAAMGEKFDCIKKPSRFMLRINNECMEALPGNTSEFQLISDTAAEWLLEGAAIVTPDLVEIPGELNLINLDGGGLSVDIEVLCSLILEGTVGSGNGDLITEVLNLAKELISGTALSGLELVCANSKNCESPKLWGVKLPWETELETMGTEEEGSFFSDIILKGEYTAECTVLGTKIEESCTEPEIAVEAKNESGGSVDESFSDAFQELAGLTLGSCGGHAEVAEITGLVTVTPVGGGSLSVSS